MGVPAFYRWLSEKYPKIVQDVLEERVRLAPNSGSIRLPFDSTQPNPSDLECDNLYIDMNGIIHPCSHPEVGPQPTTEEEMYENVCNYVDRLFRIFRPRRLLYLAIDGVAPRAKMNQQRARRFRSAQEARELLELESAVREELTSNGERAPPPKKQQAWDSNVITPGTPFMIQLAAYVRFYIRKRISQDKAWRNIRVIFSDASLPGEGEHKIMSHIRLQRCQPGYNPNLVHVLHGLDADLIMLALATHEAHFYIAREEVLFGRKSQEQQDRRQLETGFRDAQRQLDEAAGAESMQLPENQQKPLQRISIPILREYLANEFAECFTPERLPFAPSLERLIDDIVFLCFFVGNDFLPHLPSLDIRDGALDYLFNVYKRLLPGLGDYITRSGGNVNLSHVDVLLAEVGAIEDYVFSMKHDNEQRERQRREQMLANKRKNPGPGPPLIQPVEQQKLRGRAAKILEKQEHTEAVALSTRKEARSATIKVSHKAKEENAAAAQVLKESLGLVAVPVEDESKGVVTERNSKKRSRDIDESGEHIQANGDGSSITEDAMEVDSNKDAKEKGVVGEIEDEFDADEDDDEYEGDDTLAADVDKPKLEDLVDAVVDPEAAKRFKEKVKIEQDKKLDEYSKNVEDKVRLHEAGWKDRYYSDKCKADDVENHGGREHLFRSYVMGLCWVMKYYYDGCPSWKWYYPFHYGPFASDLKNIERFEKDCKLFELSTPFNPVEQLMAVLPSDSAHAIPIASRWLMKDPESPIIDFYPKDVPVDPNGKAMPWLWVVLLPFIEEDRLLAALSPTMTDWSKTELFCNARGLDDGYLYVHKDHGLAKKFKTVLQNGKTAKDPKTKLTDAVAYGCPGFSGSVRPPLSNELFPVDKYSVVPRLDSADKITNVDGISIFADDIDPNDAVCVAFTEPSKLSHKSILLPGAKLAPPILTADDKRIRRPRLNRGGGSIANMGVSNGQSYQAGHGSMNIGTYERNLAQQTGRGADMYRTGNRAWGAMEPMPKRRTVPPQVTNPFMNQHGGGMNPGVTPAYANQQGYQQQRPQWNSGAGAGQYQQLYHHHSDPQQQHQSYQNQHQPYREYAPQQQQQQHGFQSQHQPYRRQAPPPPPPPPQQQERHQGYQYPSQHQMNGSGLRQQQRQQEQVSYHGNSYAGSDGRVGHAQGPQQNYNTTGQPPQQQQNFSFRSLNQGPNVGHPHVQHGLDNGPPQVRRSRASADVMNSLRAQLNSTLNQKARNPNSASDQQSYRR